MSKRYLISASKLDRLVACPASAVLPLRTSESGVYAERGNIIHEYARRVAPDPSQAVSALECVPLEYRKTCQDLDIFGVLHNKKIELTESAYAVDAATGEVTYLGQNIGRDYEGAMHRVHNRTLRDTEVCTSLDAEGMTLGESPRPFTLDWKSGSQTKAAKDLNQLWLQSYVLAVKHDADVVEGGCAYIAEDGSIYYDYDVWNRMELDDYPGKLLAIQKAIASAQIEVDNGKLPVLSPGEHCTYCESLRGCPATTALIRSTMTELDNFDASAIMSLSMEQVGAAYGKWKQYKKLGEKLEDALKAMIAQNGGTAPADAGFEYRQTTGTRSYLPPDAVRGLLVKNGISLDEVTKLQKTTSYPIVKRVKVKNK